MEDVLFRQARRLVSMFSLCLDIIAEIKTEHDIAIDQVGQALSELEDFIEEQGMKVNLTHLINLFDFLNDEKIKIYRKRILDHGNNLKRELDQEKINERNTI